MSILEEATIFAVGPMMGVFNNLTLFDQSVKQASLQSIVPDLATAWAWSEDGMRLTFQLRHGVKCMTASRSPPRTLYAPTICRMDKAPEKLRVNPGFRPSRTSTNSRPTATSR